MPNKTIKLSKYEVDIIPYLTWGQKEEIQAVVLNGAKVDNTGIAGFDAKALLESKYKALELCITEIREGETKKSFSKEWMNALSVEDGDLLYNSIDDLVNKKK